jgi:uncharacterized membrane protein YjjP (DUF1212 family)
MDHLLPDAETIDEVAHLALYVGRLLLLNGADTGQVEAVRAGIWM